MPRSEYPKLSDILQSKTVLQEKHSSFRPHSCPWASAPQAHVHCTWGSSETGFCMCPSHLSSRTNKTTSSRELRLHKSHNITALSRISSSKTTSVFPSFSLSAAMMVSSTLKTWWLNAITERNDRAGHTSTKLLQVGKWVHGTMRKRDHGYFKPSLRPTEDLTRRNH